jgi:hypothetical protein
MFSHSTNPNCTPHLKKINFQPYIPGDALFLGGEVPVRRQRSKIFANWPYSRMLQPNCQAKRIHVTGYVFADGKQKALRCEVPSSQRLPLFVGGVRIVIMASVYCKNCNAKAVARYGSAPSRIGSTALRLSSSSLFDNQPISVELADNHIDVIAAFDSPAGI